MLTEVRTLVQEAAHARQEMTRRVEGLTNEQASYRASIDTWSITEVIEHLVLAEKNGVYSMWSALEAWRRRQPLWKEGHPDRDKNIEEIIAKTWQAKELAPPGATPRHGGPLAHWLAEFVSCQPALETLAADIGAEELDEVIYPHFLSGPLTLRQRFGFIRYHIEHHLPQVERVMRDPGLSKEVPERPRRLVEL